MSTDFEQTLTHGSIRDIGALLRRRALSVSELLDWTLRRIEALDRGAAGCNAVRAIADDAVEAARRADAAFGDGSSLPPLFGIPVLLKDNILAGPTMPASAGVRALAEWRPSYKATLVRKLERAGALIVGKANLCELADYVSDVMPAGFSGAGGLVVNPLTKRGYERGQGSSVGSAAAVAARLVPLAIGSETQNSIQTPCAVSGVAGFKPSVGMISRAGMVPLVPSQDTAGPITRSFDDAALAFACMAGADCRDTATLGWPPLTGAWSAGAWSAGAWSTEAWPAGDRPAGDFSRGSGPEDGRPRGRGLAGVRIGIPRLGVGDGLPTAQADAFDSVLRALAAAGAVIVDPCELPGAPTLRGTRSCVFPAEFHAAFDAFLHDHGAPCGIASLRDLIAWNEAHPEAIPYGQSLLIAASQAPELDSDTYRRDRALDLLLTRQGGIDAAFASQRVELLLAPMSVAARITGKAGAPVAAIPAGKDRDGAAFAVTAIARPGDDHHLLALAGAIEGILDERFGASAPGWLSVR
ncbi:MAG: amidase family protein [Burkholderiaceae bacterium]